MNIEWIDALDSKGIVSLYSSNMVLNVDVLSYFSTSYKVRIGYVENGIVIKPISKQRYDRGDLKDESLLNVSIKKTYGRISSTLTLKNIALKFDLLLCNKARKFQAEWVKEDNLLFVNLKKEIV